MCRRNKKLFYCNTMEYDQKLFPRIPRINADLQFLNYSIKVFKVRRALSLKLEIRNPNSHIRNSSRLPTANCLLPTLSLKSGVP